MEALRKDLDDGGNSQTFWQNINSPLVEPLSPSESLVTFLWRGTKHNVRLFGALFGGHTELKQLANSDVWYKTYHMPNSSRLSYQLAPDVPKLPGSARDNKVAILATVQRDPFNTKTWRPSGQDKYATHSVLELSDAPQDNWLKENPEVTKGNLSKHTVFSKKLNNTREITLYTPANFAVFVSNPSRESRRQELPPNPDFAYFMAKELMPWFKAQTQASPSPTQTLVSGSSYGGLASAWVALQYPEVFGAVLSQSGSFWWAPKDFEQGEWLSHEYASANKHDVRFYLNAGLFETGQFSIDILESNRHFYNVLKAKGYPVKYEEYASGHDYFSWRVNLAKGLVHLLSEK